MINYVNSILFRCVCCVHCVYRSERTKPKTSSLCCCCCYCFLFLLDVIFRYPRSEAHFVLYTTANKLEHEQQMISGWSHPYRCRCCRCHGSSSNLISFHKRTLNVKWCHQSFEAGLLSVLAFVFAFRTILCGFSGSPTRQITVLQKKSVMATRWLVVRQAIQKKQM